MAPPPPPSPRDALVLEHADLVYRVVLRILRSPDDAADVTQEALVKVWRRGDAVAADRRRAWCARVARNAALDHLRRRACRPCVPVDPDRHPEPVSMHPLPDGDAEGADVRRLLVGALDGLDEPYRSIVVLREVEGLAYQEIADALDLPLNTMKVYLHRAKKRLREALLQADPQLMP